MSEVFWDAPFHQPLRTREGRLLRTLRDADEFVRHRCASLTNPVATAALAALKTAANSGKPVDTRHAFDRARRLMHTNRWG